MSRPVIYCVKHQLHVSFDMSAQLNFNLFTTEMSQTAAAISGTELHLHVHVFRLPQYHYFVGVLHCLEESMLVKKVVPLKLTEKKKKKKK